MTDEQRGSVFIIASNDLSTGGQAIWERGYKSVSMVHLRNVNVLAYIYSVSAFARFVNFVYINGGFVSLN